MNRMHTLPATTAASGRGGWIALLRAGLSVHGVIWPLALFALYALIRLVPGKPLHLVVLVPLLAPAWLWKLAHIQRSLRLMGVPNVGRPLLSALLALAAGALALGVVDALRMAESPVAHALRATSLLSLGAVVALLQVRMVWAVVLPYVALVMLERLVHDDSALAALAHWQDHVLAVDRPLWVQLAEAVALAMAAAWLWRDHVRADGEKIAAIRVPLFMMLGGGQWQDQVDVTAAGSGVGVVRSAYGPDRPVRAIRSWIGGGFQPMSARRLPALALLWAVAIACAFAIRAMPPSLSEPISACLFVVVLGMTAIGLSLQLERLKRLMSVDSGERAELALLPGWGGAERARRMLVRATLLHFAGDGLHRGLMVGLVTWLAAEAFAVGPMFAIAIALGYVLLVALTMVAALAILGGNALAVIPSFALVVMILSATLGVSQLVLTAIRTSPSGWLVAALVACGLATAVALLWREIRRRPHPYLPG